MATECSPEALKALGLHHKIRLGSDPTAPLVFLVHGRAGNYDVMWAFRRCIPESFSIIAPQAPQADPVGGFSWWDIASSSAKEGGGSAASQVVAFVTAAEAFYGLTPRCRLACGFSQGAGTLSVVLQRNSLFSGVALLAGFVVETECFSGNPQIPIFMAHGLVDEMVPIERARHGRDILEARGFSVEFVEDDVGHKIGTGGMRALSRWFASFEDR